MSIESPQFFFLFLPLALAGFYLLLAQWKTSRGATLWLLACSLAFYAMSSWKSLAVVLLSASLNFWLARLISARKKEEKGAKGILIFGCAADVALLSYFKYAGFFAAALGGAGKPQWAASALAIPLGISFFTFQQISYLVDAYRGEAVETTFYGYCAWVTFFPKVTAGPILRSDEMLPQLGRLRVDPQDLSMGSGFIVLGLAKKFMLADRLAPIAGFVFSGAGGGLKPDLLLSWVGLAAYTTQIYFDFSGYCDIAIGLGLLFGLKLPINFNSPYKAASIIEFWRRWHITLTRFLTEYLYFALPGARSSATMRYINTMITMLLCGLWHGAGWNFVIWGGLHGALLLTNHAWRDIRRLLNWTAPVNRWWSMLPARVLTLVSVMVAWVFFATPSLREARPMLAALAGSHGLSLPRAVASRLPGLTAFGLEPNGLFRGLMVGSDSGYTVLSFVLIAMGLAIFGPNTQEWLGWRRKPKAPARKWFEWSPSLAYGVAIGVLGFVLMKYFLQLPPSPFVYGGF